MFLAWGHMDVGALGVSERLHRGGFIAVVMYSHFIHGESGETLDTALEVVGHSRKVRAGFRSTLYRSIHQVSFSLQALRLRRIIPYGFSGVRRSNLYSIVLLCVCVLHKELFFVYLSRIAVVPLLAALYAVSFFIEYEHCILLSYYSL